MTTQGSDHDDVAGALEGDGVSPIPTPAGGRLVHDLAASRETLTSAKNALEAALAEGEMLAHSQHLSNVAADLEGAADQVARAERLAEAEARRAAILRRENEALAARLTDLQIEVRTLKERVEEPGPERAPPGYSDKTTTTSLKSRLKRVVRSWRRRSKPPRISRRPPTDSEAAAAIEATGLFDADWYLSKYPDVRDAGAAPLEHFLHHGGSEGRKPGPAFDTRWYVAQSSDAAQSGLNPLVHYALYGKPAGLRPMDGGLRPEDDPDVLLLLGSPLFDADDYRARFPGLAKGRHAVARHYLDIGWRKGANPGPGFDGRRYLDRHHDVKEADVNPLVHYLRHGRDEGREMFSGPATTSGDPRSASKVSSSLNPTIGVREPEPMQVWPWTRLNALQLDETAAGILRVGDLVVGANGSGDKAAIDGVLATFEAFARPHLIPGGDIGRFSSTRTIAVVDAWFVTMTTLRVRLAPNDGFASVVRCYQWELGGDAVRLLSEQAVRADGLPIVDVKLANPFVPVLVMVDDGNGEVSTACIIAFPSLARNGDHHAELAATAAGIAPGSLVNYGADLGREWLRGARAGDLSLAAIEIDLGGAIGGERVLASPFLVWARAGMGLSVSCATTAAKDSTSVLRSQLASINEKTPLAPRRSRGMVLTINADELPGLRALVSRTLSPTAAGRAAFVVADVIRGKPHWLITPPSKGPDLSGLQPLGPGAIWPSIRGTAKAASYGEPSNFPVAIRYQESSLFDEEAALLFPTSPDSAKPLLSQRLPARFKRSPAVSVVLSIGAETNAATASATLSSVLGQDAGLVKEVILLLDEEREDLTIEARAIAPDLKVVLDQERSRGLNRATDLASGAYFLMVEAGVVLQDRRTLHTLLTLAASPGVSSASCAVIEQATARNGQKLTWVSGGVFPSHIDLIGRPALTFGEPRSPSALPATTYAVACNRMRLALIPSKLWNTLGGLDEVNFPDRDYDLDLALRALETGGAHLCTTAVTALLLAHSRFDDSNDPGSTAMLSPEAWSRALERMTLLRDLG